MTWNKTASGLVLPSSAASRARPIPGTSSKVARLGTIAFWAHDGVVNWVEEDSGRYGQLVPERARRQLPKIASHIGVSTDPGLERDAKERRQLTDQLRTIEEIIAIAAEQWEEKQRKIRLGLRN